MPKLSVYLSDDLYAAAKAHDLALSSLLRGAVEAELALSDRRAWVARMSARGDRTIPVIDTAAALDAARDEFGR